MSRVATRRAGAQCVYAVVHRRANAEAGHARTTYFIWREPDQQKEEGDSYSSPSSRGVATISASLRSEFAIASIGPAQFP
jgi:hypothetical protein